MAAPANVQARPALRTIYGFLNLTGLLALAIAVTTVLTIYLLRLDQSPKPSTTRPQPYQLLVQSGTQLWSVAPGGHAHLTTLATVPGNPQTFVAGPDGNGMLVVSTAAGTDKLYIIHNPGQPAEQLPIPPASFGTGPWHEVGSVWVGSREIVALLANAGSPGNGVLARFDVGQTPARAESWRQLPPGRASLASLSPDALQVARVVTLPAADGFAPQVQVRLNHLSSSRRSVALQYLGSALPSAILWSPDGGTLVMQVPGLGLSIQKSSGRPVRSVPDGALPAAFSPRGASLAYVSGSATRWQLHVLNLHGEVDNVLAPPAADKPTILGWTPDARALVYGTGRAIWQVDPANGVSTKIADLASGTLVSVVPAGSPFAR